MQNDFRKAFETLSHNDSGNMSDEECQWDNFNYKSINPDRLRKQAWMAARQRIMSDSDDDFSEGSCSFGDSLRSVTKEPQIRRSNADFCRSRPRTAPCRSHTGVPDALSCMPPEPAAFSRPSRYRTQTTCRPERKCDAKDMYADGSEIRHTIKSRDMSNFGHLKRCVVDQIDFIKQRDGVWSNDRLYKAVEILGTFMQEHQFRYIYLPDHQRQWLADMISRLDQWSTSKIPFSAEYEKYRAYDERRRKYKERVDAECYRLINPQNFEKQEEEKRVAQALLHREMVMKHRQDQARRQARLDLIEHRTRDPTRRSRIAEQQMPIELRPPRYPRGSRSLSRDDLVPSKPIRLQHPLKIPHRSFKEVTHEMHAAKLFGDGIRGRMEREESPPGARRRSSSKPRSGAIKQAIAKSVRTRPKTAGNATRGVVCEPPKERSDVAVAPDDLMELLDLIQDIESKQKEINGELQLLRDEAKFGSRRPKIPETWWEGKSGGTQPNKREANADSRAVPDMSRPKESRGKSTLLEEPKHIQGKKCHPKVSEAWWEGRSVPSETVKSGTATTLNRRQESSGKFQSSLEEIDRAPCRSKPNEAWWMGTRQMKRSGKPVPENGPRESQGSSMDRSSVLKKRSRQLTRRSRAEQEDRVWLKAPDIPPKSQKVQAPVVGPPKIPDAWWEGRKSVPVVKSVRNREDDKRRQNVENADSVMRAINCDIDAAVNCYVSQLVQKEFAISSAQ